MFALNLLRTFNPLQRTACFWNKGGTPVIHYGEVKRGRMRSVVEMGGLLYFKGKSVHPGIKKYILHS